MRKSYLEDLLGEQLGLLWSLVERLERDKELWWAPPRYTQQNDRNLSVRLCLEHIYDQGDELSKRDVIKSNTKTTYHLSDTWEAFRHSSKKHHNPLSIHDGQSSSSGTKLHKMVSCLKVYKQRIKTWYYTIPYNHHRQPFKMNDNSNETNLITNEGNKITQENYFTKRITTSHFTEDFQIFRMFSWNFIEYKF